MQAVRVELLPAGERAPEQLRQVSSRARHLGGADGRLGPGGHPEDDGRGGRRRRCQPAHAQEERAPQSGECLAHQ